MAGGAKRAVLIAGPTASGKSARTLALAREIGGAIVNADAMQVYEGLSVVTARPGAADMAQAPHLLYGTVPAETRFSTGAWLRAVAEIVAAESRPLIFVGGTGLYFDALLDGFADVPEVDPAVVDAVEAELAGLDEAGRRAALAAVDPGTAGRLPTADPQRTVRAIAVARATGRALSDYQAEAAGAGVLAGYEIERVVLDPGRDVVRARIAERFAAMMAAGAREEVAALLARRLDPGLPVMKAIGVREIGALLRGEIDEAAAVAQAVTASRQYAKRQRTWFRNRMADWPRVVV